MQSTHKVPGSSATTWSKYLVSEASRGDYYTHDGKGGRAAPTQWHGPEQLLRSYDIDPDKAVELRHLRPLMHGFDPVTKEPIRPAGSDKTRVAAIDLSYGAPKDVSALWATSSPYRRAQIEVAHKRAVKSALQRTEREVAVVRRKTGGVQRFETAKGLLSAEALHTTSRLAKDQETGAIPDPQLHSHIAVIAAERQDGVIAAVESRQLMLAAREGGAWYRSELAANLRELGVDIERRTGNGERYFDIRGVSKDLSEHWSKRSQDVDRAAKTFRQRYGREPGHGELDSLTLSTRGSKSAAPPAEITAAWRALGEEHGQTAQRSEELFHDWGLHNKPVDLREELIAEVTKDRSTINTHELHAKAYELSAGVCRPAEADRLVEELHRSGELLRLEDGTWTTRRLRQLEQTTLDIAERRATELAAPVSEQSLKQARREIGKQIKGSLTQEQRDALQTITGPGGIAVLVGPAGTGKGIVISTAARAWQLEGTEVIGIAVAGATAQRLQADASLDRSYSADELNHGIQQGHIRIGPNTVIVFDEAAMADHERIAPLVKLTAERGAKPLLVGDAAQLSTIGPGGLFAALEGTVPTAELHEVHRANHEWERRAWQQIRAGEPGPALAQYQSHDRLHIHDTRAEAAQAMVQNWDDTRNSLPGGRAVMITDASNLERDQMNAMAQERRAEAGELGAHTVELPGKPYGLRAGDEIIFSAKYRVPGEQRIKNGITGTVLDASRDKDKVAIKTNEHEPREVEVDTSKFSDLSLSYAVHVNKGQGITAETSGILIGGWQTDKEHAYVTVSRAREQTQIYVSREDLGEMGLDTGAMERLADKMKRSRAQEATIRKKILERDDDTIAHDRSPEPAEERIRSETRERAPQPPPDRQPVAINIQDASPTDVQIKVQDFGNIQMASSQVYDFQAHTGQPTYVLFGGWQTDTEQGFVAVAQTGERTDVRMNTEQRGERDIATELTDRVGQVIERSQTQEPDNAHQASSPQTDRERQHDQPAQLEPGKHNIDHAKDAGRDSYIDQAIQEERDRQQAFEQGIDPDRDNDLAFGIE